MFRFATELQRAGIEDLTDASEIDIARLSPAIEAIPGQGSGVSFKCFLMLAGYEKLIKPDRMVRRFVARAIGRESITPETAEKLLLSAHRMLQSQVPDLTAVALDYRIWRHEREIRGH